MTVTSSIGYGLSSTDPGRLQKFVAVRHHSELVQRRTEQAVLFLDLPATSTGPRIAAVLAHASPIGSEDRAQSDIRCTRGLASWQPLV